MRMVTKIYDALQMRDHCSVDVGELSDFILNGKGSLPEEVGKVRMASVFGVEVEAAEGAIHTLVGELVAEEDENHIEEVGDHLHK